ncbi:unnamed protein product [Ostreobium quekettii]|uniref:Potassium channel tetramerisation-type BTB domain-containing protein n=1 Tax=Ostreobium quekettii TaxID=121088 RepID=A0A8S1J7N5_9CHLO|nr:unnamed protein product [Ostreobium quekettii]
MNASASVVKARASAAHLTGPPLPAVGLWAPPMFGCRVATSQGHTGSTRSANPGRPLTAAAGGASRPPAIPEGQGGLMSDYEALRTTFLSQVDRQLESFKERDKDLHQQREELRDRSEEVDREQQRLQQEREGLEREKAQMQKVQVQDDDVVELNVQGEVMCTLRGTLTQIPDSKLAYMFNGRWEDKMRKDSQGRYFLNYMPSCFRKILDHLTTRELTGDHPLPTPTVDADMAASYEILVHHLGLNVAFFGGFKFSRTLKSTSVRLSPDALMARNDSAGEGYVLGEHGYKNKVVEFTLLIEKLDAEFARMFIGVLAEGHPLNSDNSFRGNPGAFGWAGAGQVWVAGKRQQGLGDYPKALLCEGLALMVTLDCRDGHNVMSLRSEAKGTEYQIAGLPEGQCWRIHVNMVGEGDQVRFVNVRTLTE